MGEFIVHVEDTGSNALSYTDTDVTEQGNYTYRVKARNAAGLSPRSSYADAKIPQGPPWVSVSFASSSYSADEGGSVVVGLNLDADPERTVVVNLTVTDENGASSDDYSGIPGKVSFNSGDTSASFTFSATDDTEDDNNESVTISIDSGLPGRVSLGARTQTQPSSASTTTTRRRSR